MKEKKLAFPPNFFEKKAWENDFLVCGIDEAGRGCLAGPVVVAAVIMPKNSFHELLIDSKQLSKKERELAYEWITHHCQFAIATACHKNIDDNNIYQATRHAMQKAYTNLIEKKSIALPQLKYLLADAMPLDIDKEYMHKELEVRHFNYGESISSTIAAASIVAKVTRDHLIDTIDAIFPAYALKQHKGYGTKIHQEALTKYGPSLIHRRSFLSNFQASALITETSHQQTLFGLP